MKKRTIESSLVVGFAAVLVVLLLAGGQMYRSLHEYMDTMRWVEHTHQVIRSLNAVTSAMRELESGQRAYIITHDEFHQADYKHNKGEIDRLLARISQLTIDNKNQQIRSSDLLKVADERLRMLDKTIEVYHSQGFDAARDFIKTDVSRLKMEAVLKQTNAMVEIELDLLKQRREHAERNAGQALKVGGILVMTALSGLLLLWWRVKCEAQKRHAAEDAVHENEQMQQVFDLLQEKNIELESARTAAEKANLAKSEFLSSMSHELRSPLNAILGFTQLMETDSPPPTPGQQESIAQILKAGWHLLTLINEILDLAKVESRQMPLSNEPVSLTEVIIECQNMIEPQAKERGIKIIFPQLALPCFVMADRTRVKQVLINLLTNAIKYNCNQGLVEVKCTENTPGRVLVSVRDSGAGLRPEQVEQLFQAFNRLGQEAGNEEGTGIGLVVAKRLVELMGGIIGVESTIGIGSVFWFELIAVDEPKLLIDENDATVAGKRYEPCGSQLHTVLYVEDNPANLKLVEQIIARHPNIRLLTALNGNNGIELARTSLPDVILMDINLPGISGIETMKILHADPITANIPVIALSANAMPLDILKGLDEGFFRYITKPIKVNEFMDALNVALEYAEKLTHKNT
jgi:signal transduction histidine kinase/ActR/RegA family two-component response regulator